MKLHRIQFLWLALVVSCGGELPHGKSAGFIISPRAPRPIVVGASRQLSTNTSGAYNWQSSNPAVAVVDSSGVVRGVAPGAAKITASVSSANGTLTTATAYVTVRERRVAHTIPAS